MNRICEHFGEKSLAAAFVVVVCLCQGCGTGEYERRLNERVKTLGADSGFAKLDQVVDLPGSPVVLGVPGTLKRLDASAEPGRLNPPFMEIPSESSPTRAPSPTPGAANSIITATWRSAAWRRSDRTAP